MKFSWRMSPLVIYKILELFVNILTDDDKYSLLTRDNLAQPIQMQLSKKKMFSKLFSSFFKCRSNFEHFEKKMTFIDYVFPKLRTVKHIVR